MKTKLVRKTDKAMKFLFKCPLCPQDEAIVRGSQEFLDLAVSSHILFHEERASLRSVDRARVECVKADCEIGRRGVHSNLSIGKTDLSLTDFDKHWLQAMKIGVE